ncbi:MAG: 4Fe-4S dicluster domain-containing protein [Clostridiales bacterium]|nr:4Fe-4S dicluster domain-containing protein [Clostridiales bacterium]
MSHHTAREAYQQLGERLNRFPQGAPPSEMLYKILGVLVSEQEAAFLAALPIRPFTARRAAKALHMTVPEATTTLDTLASRAMLIDIVKEGEETRYMMPPPMAGFIEFALMRVRTDIDQQLLSELYHQYLNVEGEFMHDLFYGVETKLGRVFVQELMVSESEAVHILDYERATHVIETAEHIAVGMCYCRHKMEHMGMACNAPMDVCLTFGNVADALSRHGHSRAIGKSEALDTLARSYEANLVQCGENVRQGVSFICNCCGCCCEAMLAAKRYGLRQPVYTTGFSPLVEEASCVGCGKCAKVCPVDAIQMATGHIGEREHSVARIDYDICLGCGVCVRNCPPKCIDLKANDKKVLTPVNSTHRIVLAAIEKGQLANLVFDTPAFASHRAMGTLLTVILRLPPIKRAMASEQMKSKYLARLIAGRK